MSDDGPIRTVLVAGGGIVGWSAAAALKRRLPQMDVSILPITPPANSLSDRLSGTLPSIAGFHEDLGLTEADTVSRAGSGLRMGTRFEGWNDDLPSYVHAYGPVGEPIQASPFHQQWLRVSTTSAVDPFDRFSPTAEAARAGREPALASTSADHGLNLTVADYLTMMRAFAQHIGVRVSHGELRDVVLRRDGFIDHVLLDGDREYPADLFVDATGPDARLRSAMGDDFELWKHWLIADRIHLGEQPATQAGALDRNTATDCGWIWEASSARVATRGFVCSSGLTTDNDLHAHGFAENNEAIAFRQGRRSEPWRFNCVAVGDAAIVIDPLEWTNLHLAHNSIDRLVAMMPGKDCAPVELAEYNRQSADEAARVRDFLCLHYALGPVKRGAFWREAAAVELPASLRHTLALFLERGRLPFYEEETFDRDSWLTVLLCQGARPSRVDALAEIVPFREAQRALLDIRARALALQFAPKAMAAPTFESRYSR